MISLTLGKNSDKRFSCFTQRSTHCSKSCWELGTERCYCCFIKYRQDDIQLINTPMSPAWPHRRDSTDLRQLRLPPQSASGTLNHQTALSGDKKRFIYLKYQFNTETTEANFCQVLSVIGSTLHVVSVCSGWRGQHDGCESLSLVSPHTVPLVFS